MPTYLTLWKWTEQGAKNAAGAVERAQGFKADIERRGGKVIAFMWTLGQYDGFVVAEAPNDETVTSALLGVAQAGNAMTQTLRAFNEEEMKQIIGKV
jgi:uncharacterized protein with GYD domain